MEKPVNTKKKVTMAVLASVLFHLLLLFFFAFWVELKASQTPIKLIEDKPLEITILPDPTPPLLAVAPTPPPEREIIRSDDMQEAATPPPDADFDSDRDTAAGGNQPGSGPENMPNVDGRIQGDLSLQQQEAVTGGKSAAPRSQDPQKPEEKSTPQATPAKVEATPEPTPPPTPTPEPSSDDALALGRSTPTPQASALPTPRPPATSAGGEYRPQTRPSEIQGSLSNRGRPSIAARGTPLGRYMRQVENAIGSRWYFYIKRDAAFVAPGAVKIIFTIDRSGKAGNLRVLGNTSNESFASTCTQSIMDAEFPPIPDEVASTLFTQRLELPFTFTIY